MTWDCLKGLLNNVKNHANKFSLKSGHQIIKVIHPLSIGNWKIHTHLVCVLVSDFFINTNPGILMTLITYLY